MKIFKFATIIFLTPVLIGRIYFWSLGKDHINKKRILPLCFAIWLAFPYIKLNYLFILNKYAHLVFIIDDLFDEGKVTRQDILDFITDVKNKKINYKRYSKFSEFISIYFESKIFLYIHANNINSNEFWEQSLIQFLNYIVQESELKYDDLSVSDYLCITRETTSIKMFTYYLYNLKMFAKFDQEEIDELINLGSELIRLSNDIATYSREKNLPSRNILKLLMHQGHTFNESMQIIERLIAERKKKFRKLQLKHPKYQNYFTYISYTLQMYKIMDFTGNKIVRLFMIWFKLLWRIL